MFLGPYAMTRAAFWEWPRLHGVVALVCLVVFAATAAGWAVGAITRRLAGGPPGAVPWPARGVGLVIAVLDAGFLAGSFGIMLSAAPYALLERVPPALTTLRVIPLVTIPLTLALPILLVRSGPWTPLGRLHYALLTLTAFTFAGFVYYWNLLGLR